MKFKIYETHNRLISDANVKVSKVEEHFKTSIRDYYRILDVNKFGRLLQHFYESNRGAMIISASRAEYTDEENLKRYENLIQTIRNKGLSYIPSIGGSKEGNEIIGEELSAIVPRPPSVTEKDFFNIAIELCKKYNQDSVLVILPELTNGKAKYFDQNTNVDMEFDLLRLSTKEDKFYTETRGKSTKNRFSFLTKDYYGVKVGETVASNQLESNSHNALYYPNIINIDKI